MNRSSTHILLGEATRDLHRRLDSHDALKALVSPAVTRTTYIHAMQSLCSGFQLIEAAIEDSAHAGEAGTAYTYIARRHALEQDLQMLSAGDRSCPECRIPVLDSYAGWLGACYVIEGSTRGAVHIARNLRDRLPDISRSAFRFWTLQERLAADWPRFLTALARHDTDALAQRQAVDAAKQTFDIFLGVFDTVDECQT